MKERVALAKNVAAGDAEATAFKPNYMYLHEDGVTFYFEPTFIPPIRLEYQEPGREDRQGVIVMPPGVGNPLKAALNAALNLCKGRMETPFVPPVPAAPEGGER